MTTQADAPTKTNPHAFLLAGEAEGAPGLRAARCEACGAFTIGRVPACGTCFSRRVREVAAGRRARLVECATAHVPAGGFEAPYAIGQILTEEGLTLFAPLIGDPGDLGPGTPLDFALVDAGSGQTGFAYRRAPGGSME